MTKVKITLVGWLAREIEESQHLEYEVVTDGMTQIIEVLNYLMSQDPRIKSVLDRTEGQGMFLLNGRHIDLNRNFDKLPSVCEITVIPPLIGG